MSMDASKKKHRTTDYATAEDNGLSELSWLRVLREVFVHLHVAVVG